MRRWRAAAFATLFLRLGLPSVLRAQDTTRATAPIAVHAPAPRTVPVLPFETPAGPLPPGSRYTFTRDSVSWSSAASLADLLARVPGVYVARAGFLGQPEYVAYGGRGAATLEVYRDGVPIVPLGGDSVFIVPSKIPLTTLQRVDVEVLPAELRVYLISERHETVDTRSVVGVMSGDFGTGQYAGLFQKRWPGGFGLNLGADFFASNGAPAATRTDQDFEAWARAEWLPRPNAGAVYQLRRQSDDHDALGGLSGTGSPARHGARTDATLQLFVARRADRRGLSATFDLASESWTHDSTVPERTIRMAIGRMTYAAQRGTAELTGQVSDGPWHRTLEGRIGWVLLPGVVASGEARVAAFAGDRTGLRTHGAVSIQRGPFSLVGEASYTREPETPVLPTDSVRRVVDRSIRAGFVTRPFGGHAGFVRRGAYEPLAFPDLRSVSRLSAAPPSVYFVSDVQLQPIRPLTLEGWYSHPARGGADFQPPHHGRAAITFRSKFWRTFRSGAFDLKVQVAVESWSTGNAGQTSTGQLLTLNGLSFTETYLAFQIVGFTAFWDLRNAWNTRDSYVPGFQPYPRNAQTFGVKWEFMN